MRPIIHTEWEHADPTLKGYDFPAAWHIPEKKTHLKYWTCEARGIRLCNVPGMYPISPKWFIQRWLSSSSAETWQIRIQLDFLELSLDWRTFFGSFRSSFIDVQVYFSLWLLLSFLSTWTFWRSFPSPSSWWSGLQSPVFLVFLLKQLLLSAPPKGGFGFDGDQMARLPYHCSCNFDLLAGWGALWGTPIHQRWSRCTGDVMFRLALLNGS